MSSTDQNTPTAKPARRNRKGERNRKPDQAKRPKEDQLQEAKEAIAATAEPADTAPIDVAAPADTAPIEAAAAADTAPIDVDAPADGAPVDEEAPADTAPVSLQTIATAYGDYTRKSLEETRSFVEKLKGVRSLDKAVEVQTEFARQAFEMFVAESQKIYGLHKELAKQTLKPLEQMASKATRDER